MNELIVKADEKTGEIIEHETITENLYSGIGQIDITEEEAATLNIDLDPMDIEILPQQPGILYLPQIKYRQILIKAFGPGKWALRQVSIGIKNDTIFYDGILYIKGKYMAQAMGEQTYFENNSSMSYVTCVEGAKSDCLTRCCKDLAIAWKLWDPNFIRSWKEEYAENIYVNNLKNHKKEYIWKRKDRPLEWPYSLADGKEPESDNQVDQYVLDNASKPDQKTYAEWKATLSKDEIKAAHGYYKKTSSGFDWYKKVQPEVAPPTDEIKAIIESGNTDIDFNPEEKKAIAAANAVLNQVKDEFQSLYESMIKSNFDTEKADILTAKFDEVDPQKIYNARITIMKKCDIDFEKIMSRLVNGK